MPAISGRDRMTRGAWGGRSQPTAGVVGPVLVQWGIRRALPVQVRLEQRGHRLLALRDQAGEPFEGDPAELGGGGGDVGRLLRTRGGLVVLSDRDDGKVRGDAAAELGEPVQDLEERELV